MSDQTTPDAIGWAILELMGHRRLAGFVSEQEVAGHGMIRLDVYAEEPPETDEDEQPIATQLYSPAALYCVTPTTEKMARAVGARNRPEPVARWELPAPADADAAGEPW